MKCKYETCHNESKGSSVYCSNSCRAKQSKRNRSGATSGAQPVIATKAQPSYVLIPDDKVYGRSAVHYELDDFETRPEPLDDHDEPLARNRGRYTRPDGTQYQFDAAGQVFEVTNGKVYQTIADVQVCYQEQPA